MSKGSLEFFAGEGGADAELFAQELAAAVAKAAGASVATEGKTQVVDCL